MSTSSMLPPTTLPHRRTRLNTNAHFPPSPPYSPESTCGPLKMPLSKGATFQIRSSPPADDDPFLSIPHLPHRSSTAPKSLLALMLGKEDGAANSIANFERQFLGELAKPRRYSSDKVARPLNGHRRERSPPLDRDTTKSPKQTHDHLSDSGLGTSISSTSTRAHSGTGSIDSTADRLLLLGIASNPSTEADTDSVESTLVSKIQGAGHLESAMPNNRHRLIHSSSASQPISQSAITRSISPSHITSPSHSSLSPFARRKIDELVFQPILQEESFEFFHPLVHSLEHQARKSTIKCLRDLEKSLIFEPLVSAVLEAEVSSSAYSFLTQRLTTSAALFRRFGEFSVQLVLDTYLHLSEPEQRRRSDRPYDNGYFLDLVQQVGRLAAQVTAARQANPEGSDEMAYSPDDEVTLEGGLGTTGEIAELVRWKNGKGISLRTNEPYEPTAGIKRSASFLEDDVERSMARRKKGALPLEMQCSDETCGKIFTRKCDLAKHEKTHSRPFKCSEPGCKYHEQGLPTEKERDRHMNDKHSSNPVFFHCQYCPFKTKRDSNCKQHMEKKHGWQYDRVKGNGKPTKSGTTPQATPQPTPQTPSVSTPVSLDYSSVRGSTASNSAFATPIEQPLDSFPDYHHESATPVHLGGTLFNNGSRLGSVGEANPYITPPGQQTSIVATPSSAISAITEQELMNTMNAMNDFEMYGHNDSNVMFSNNNNFSMMSPFASPYSGMPKMEPNMYAQMPLTPSTASGHVQSNSRDASLSLTTPITPANADLAQTISPDLAYDENFMDFAAPAIQNNQFAYPDNAPVDQSDLPMGDFNLFTDVNMDYNTTEVDAFDAYLNY